MPPRARTVAPSDAFHGSFDPGVTGRRTGVAPPLKVRRLSNGVEAFSDYFNSPRKDPSVSPIRSPSNPPDNNQAKRVASRARNDRPDLFHDIGERGRKTGISPPKNITRDENGIEEFDNYLMKATEQTNKAIARERRKSLRRKSISQALHARKLSTATFVDNSDEEEEYEEESISLATPESLHRWETHSARQGSSNQINPDQSKSRSRLSNSVDQSIRTHNDSDLIDFDVVPEGPLHSNSRNKSQDDQPMTVPDHEDDDDDDIDGMVVNEYDEGSVGSGGFEAPPPPPESSDGQTDHPIVLEDIMEADEDEQKPTAGPSAPVDSVQPPEPKKRRKSNPHPPPASGLRRGLRQRLQRLAHWRGEKVVYGRSTTPDGGQRVIGMIDVVRVPTEENQPLAQRRYRRNGFTKVKSESVAPMESVNPEELLDAETRPNGIVYSYMKQKDCERSVVCTRRMAQLDVEDKAGVPNAFQFQKLFKGTDFVAGGLLYIPVGGGKPLKPAKDNFYFFTVLEGVVSVHVHRTNFVVGPLGIFWIPRGNVYSIQNTGQRTAKLSFTQARRATGDEADLDSEDADEDEQSVDLSPDHNNQSTSNIDQSATTKNDAVLNGETSNESTKSKRARAVKNSSGRGNKKTTTNKKPTKQKQATKQPNDKQKNKESVNAEHEEEEEKEDEAQTS